MLKLNSNIINTNLVDDLLFYAYSDIESTFTYAVFLNENEKQEFNIFSENIKDNNFFISINIIINNKCYNISKHDINNKILKYICHKNINNTIKKIMCTMIDNIELNINKKNFNEYNFFNIFKYPYTFKYIKEQSTLNIFFNLDNSKNCDKYFQLIDIEKNFKNYFVNNVNHILFNNFLKKFSDKKIKNNCCSCVKIYCMINLENNIKYCFFESTIYDYVKLNICNNFKNEFNEFLEKIINEFKLISFINNYKNITNVITNNNILEYISLNKSKSLMKYNTISFINNYRYKTLENVYITI